MTSASLVSTRYTINLHIHLLQNIYYKLEQSQRGLPLRTIKNFSDTSFTGSSKDCSHLDSCIQVY